MVGYYYYYYYYKLCMLMQLYIKLWVCMCLCVIDKLYSLGYRIYLFECSTYIDKKNLLLLKYLFKNIWNKSDSVKLNGKALVKDISVCIKCVLT